MRTLFSSLAALVIASVVASAADTKVVLIAGNPSHGPGDHEHNAGVMLLADCLKSVKGLEPILIKGGWPKDETVFEGAKSVLFFMDGGSGHPMIQGERLETMQKLMDQGVGLVCIHYATEVPKGKPGDKFLEWLGGYYETGFSTNPHWVGHFTNIPTHPVTTGVKPFHTKDEWYYNIRFRPEMKGVTPLLVAKPDSEARQGKTSSPRGPYSHIVANEGRDEIVAWATERENGGRSFGTTGAHNHINWGNNDFRKLVLNAIVWTAKLEVPAGGVESEVTAEQLAKNLDPKGKK